jgi:hypothetical protein
VKEFHNSFFSVFYVLFLSFPSTPFKHKEKRFGVASLLREEVIHEWEILLQTYFVAVSVVCH